MVYADLGKIQQVLYNLIDNAIKFSHEDSIIYIQTSIRYEKIFISVKDTGIGIPKDSQKKIFERFYKTDLSRGKDKKGTGLGLAIVKEIIQAHGENIDVVVPRAWGRNLFLVCRRRRRYSKLKLSNPFAITANLPSGIPVTVQAHARFLPDAF